MITSFKHSLVHFWQRRTRGFDDTDLWSLDHHLAKLILPRLIAFRDAGQIGYPGPLTADTWETMIDAMIYSFDNVANCWDPFGERDRDDDDRINEGLELFGLWFRHLWD